MRFTLNNQTEHCTREQARELVDSLYRELLEQENHELPDPERIRAARRNYAAAEEWYATTFDVDLDWR